jgi:hypothetical protein
MTWRDFEASGEWHDLWEWDHDFERADQRIVVLKFRGRSSEILAGLG